MNEPAFDTTDCLSIRDELLTFKIDACDNILRKFSDLDLDQWNVITEFINNSIAEAEKQNVSLYVDIEFNFSEDDNRLDSIVIKDQSGGIKIGDIATCLKPADVKNTAITLNEHSMGLNIGIEFMTQNGGEYSLKSYTKGGAYEITELPSIEKEMHAFKIENNQPSGLHLEFSNINNSLASLEYPTSHMSTLWNYFWTHCCAKYRYMYNHFNENGKDFNINIKATQGSKTLLRKYAPIKPFLKNKANGLDEWTTSFTLKSDNYEILFNIGRANDDKKDYDQKIHGNIINAQNHPYRKSSNVCGFDIIYQDVVIDMMSTKYLKKLTSSDAVITNHWNLFRGEIIIIKGGRSTVTKDKIIEDAELLQLIYRALNIISGEHIHPVTGIKLNYMEKFIKTSEGSGNNLPSEKVIKYRYRQYFESTDRSVSQEETCEAGRIDMIIDKEKILEHKIKRSAPRDVEQLLRYLVYKPDIKTGELHAPEHPDSVKGYCEKINEILKPRGQTIYLRPLLGFLTNENLTDEEKKL